MTEQKKDYGAIAAIKTVRIVSSPLAIPPHECNDLEDALSERLPITAPHQAAVIARIAIGEIDTESVCVMVCDQKNHVIAVHEIARGGIASCSVEISQIYRAAIIWGAASVLLAHNHPSGDPTPSQEDISLTRRAISASDIVGVALLDHIVIAPERHCYSIRESHPDLW